MVKTGLGALFGRLQRAIIVMMMMFACDLPYLFGCLGVFTL